MTVTTLRRALVGGAAITVMLIATGCGSSGMDHDGMSPATTTSTSASATTAATFNDADVMFAQMMIPHHQQAIEMSTLAETLAQDPEVKQLAAAIKAAQQPEITTMAGWLAAWGRPTATPTDMGHGGHGGVSGMMSAEDMTSLGNARGTDFDRMFTQMMIAHHNGAIEMAQDEATNGANRDAIELAKTIIASQTAEVATMQKIVNRL
jgi:uncharacterized protein (DUF305 family)